MNLLRRYALHLALVALIGSSAAIANAETILKGTFDLPEQAFWGSQSLPPGEYTLSVDRAITGVSLINLRGESVRATIIAPITVGRSEYPGTYLRIEDLNGVHVVRELDSSALGRCRFTVAKSVRDRVQDEGAGPSASLPVSTAGF